jgi:REP element-mobilizing transposase RayT
MTHDPHRRQRRSIRLAGYDYTRPGAYFITICTQDRQRLFGAVAANAVRLSDAGDMVARWWGELPRKFANVMTDAFVVMPDHIHGIIVIGAGDAGDDIDDSNANINAPNDNPWVGADGPIRPRRHPNDRDVDDVDTIGMGSDASIIHAVSIPRIVQWFKIMTTTEYIRQVKQSGWPPFERRVWQRGYYDHIVRDDRSLARIRRYIAANPARAAADLDALLARMEERR